MYFDFPNSVFSLFAFVGFILALIPLPWHLQAWNTGTCLFMAWTGLGCLNLFINSIIWNGNTVNWAPVWCDISTRFSIGLSVAIPTALLCITRRLYLIASTTTVSTTKQEKRRGQLVDLAIGLGIPLLQMILAIIPQGHRFDILEDVGCMPEYYVTWVYIVVVGSWPIVIGLVSAGYALMSIRTLTSKRSEFQVILANSSHTSLTASRYNRLIALAGFVMFFTVPFASLILCQTIAAGGGLNPWISWSDTHSDFSFVGQFPALIWKADQTQLVDIELSRWGVVLCAFAFFAFFGASEEARLHYAIALKWIKKKARRTVPESVTIKSFGAGGTLPIFMRKDPSTKRDTLASFSCSTIIDSRRPSLQTIEKPAFLAPVASVHRL